MLHSLGFDTIAIHIDRFHSSIDQALIDFYNVGIKNFIFIFDYDPLCDSIAILKDKMNSIKKIYSKTPSIHIKIKCALNLHISQGAGFNNSVSQLYCNSSSKALLVALPLFTNDNYEPIALDINHLLYKKSSFLFLTHFDKIVESSSIDFCSKFINNSRIGLTVDLNYLLNPQKDKLFNLFLTSNSLIIPTISQNMANYAGILPSADFALNKYGKKEYYKLCSQINKASLKIFAKF